MEQKKRIFVSLFILIGLIFGFYFITGEVSKLTGYAVSEELPSAEFEKCLEKQEITLYINGEDTDAILKKTGLIDYMQYFEIKNCINNEELCLNRDISYFPTFIINGKKVIGDISSSELGEHTGCKSL